MTDRPVPRDVAPVMGAAILLGLLSVAVRLRGAEPAGVEAA